jgi:hypothetical protein
VAIDTTARTVNVIQPPMARHGWRAHAAATEPVESVIYSCPIAGTYVSATTPVPSVRESARLSAVP